MKGAAGGPVLPPPEPVSFDFKGPVYVRPVGRGVSLVNEQGEIDARLLDLSELLRHGYWQIELQVRAVPLPDPEASKGP